MAEDIIVSESVSAKCTSASRNNEGKRDAEYLSGTAVFYVLILEGGPIL